MFSSMAKPVEEKSYIWVLTQNICCLPFLKSYIYAAFIKSWEPCCLRACESNIYTSSANKWVEGYYFSCKMLRLSLQFVIQMAARSLQRGWFHNWTLQGLLLQARNEQRRLRTCQRLRVLYGFFKVKMERTSTVG